MLWRHNNGAAQFSSVQVPAQAEAIQTPVTYLDVQDRCQSLSPTSACSSELGFSYWPAQRQQASSLSSSLSSNSSSSSSSFIIFKDKAGNLLEFNPAEIKFADFQELWIRKQWLDILARFILVAPIVLLGILGNLIIIYSMCKFKTFRSKPTNIFILNMAIADLLTTLVCPVAALFTNIYQFYVLGSFICRFEGFLKIIGLLVSSYSLIVLSIDWLLCVVKPCRTRITIRGSWLALAAIWATSVLMASPLLVWRRLRERQWLDLVEVWCCEMIEYTKYYWVVIAFFLIYLPTIFMTIVLLIILAQMDKFEAKLRRSRTLQVSGARQPEQQQQKCAATSSKSNLDSSLTINMKYRRRIVKILFTYLLTSIICWSPLQFSIIYRHFRSEAIPSPWFFELAFYAAVSASLTAAMNPIIFGFLSEPFRRIVTRSLKLHFFEKATEGTNKADNQRGSAKKTANKQFQRPQPDAIYLRSAMAQPMGTQTQSPTNSHHRVQKLLKDADNKRVSFHASNSASANPNRLIHAHDNLAFEQIAQARPRSRSELPEGKVTSPQRLSNSTTSFMRNSNLPLSMVSMDSINIEENLGTGPTQEPEQSLPLTVHISSRDNKG